MQLLVLLQNRIKELRKAANLTQAELAEKAGYSTNFMALLESGERKPSLETLIAISMALNAPIKELFTFKEKSTKAQIELDSLLKLLNKKSAEDIALIRNLAEVVLQHRIKSK
jgi:putative transcriptional regulator